VSQGGALHFKKSVRLKNDLMNLERKAHFKTSPHTVSVTENEEHLIYSTFFAQTLRKAKFIYW